MNSILRDCSSIGACIFRKKEEVQLDGSAERGLSVGSTLISLSQSHISFTIFIIIVRGIGLSASPVSGRQANLDETH